MNKQDFINAGFTVWGEETKENKLIAFLKEHYPSVIKDNEINLQELKTVAGLPVDEKVNGYGLNFVGRNFARAKYAQKTDKELQLNTEMSKNIDTTQNLVLKGDNLDCLKILKNYYSGKIKCIYIDPPYNTANDEFVYPDKFDKEEAEVLGLVNLSEDDFARMEFAFSNKKSHNGWLAFMYPRLLLARDLLSKDGVIFISIDDNEQANLKLLCDDVFGEENFVGTLIWRKKEGGGQTDEFFVTEHEYIIVYRKSFNFQWKDKTYYDAIENYKEKDEFGNFKKIKLAKWGSGARKEDRPTMYFSITAPDGTEVFPKAPDGNEGRWRLGKKRVEELFEDNLIAWEKTQNEWVPYEKVYFNSERLKKEKFRSILYDIANTGDGTNLLKLIFGVKDVFENPKPIEIIQSFIKNNLVENDIILDFFAGSGTTGHAVMQLNAEDGGNRKFILVQIDELIKKDKPAYKFCIENNLPPVISSITIERLRRAGEKIKKEIEEANSKSGMFEENKKQVPDIGFKVFDTVDAPKLKVNDEGQIQFPELNNDALSRIYNMIFTVGLDEPTQVPEEVVKNCIYRIGNNYYITNSDKITSDDFANAIKNGKVFIDGWTASLNGTLQAYKEDVKIVF